MNERGKSYSATKDSPSKAILLCEKHGECEFYRESYKKIYFRYRCKPCNSEAVYRRKQRLKKKIVDAAGGACQRCGYNKSILALTFHHRDRLTKSFALSRMTSFSEAKVIEEAKKCDLLCANCHFELEGEIRMGV